MTPLLRGELIKTATTRTLLGYAGVAVVLALAQVLLMILPSSGELMSLDDKRTTVAGLPVVFVLFGLVGAAGEYRHRTVAPAVLAAGRDGGQMLLARAGAYAITGIAVAAPAMVVTLAVGLPLLASEPGPALGAADTALIAGGSLAAAALSAVFGVALGALVRSQVASVIGTLVVMFVVLPLIQQLSIAAVDASQFGVAAGLAGSPLDTFSAGGAGLMLIGWTLVALLAAVVAERRRDIA